MESWPLAAAADAPSAHWSASLMRGSCHHGRLPSLGEPPCAGLVDGCEAATLASVETEDADCLAVVVPQGTQSANHLFYRGSLERVDPLPLAVERLADGRIRVRNRGTEPIPGSLLRVRLAHAVPGVEDAASIMPPPGPGATVELAAPTGTSANAHLLRAAMVVTTTLTPAAARPMTPPRVTDSLVYFLPPAVVEQLSTLEISPRPTHVRRAIAVWVDVPAP